jgi:hypothetical protein
MINGHGRSDSAIVAERPTNKAGQLAAEPGERRADQGECGTAKHAPGSEPGKRVPGVGSHTTSGKPENEEKFTTLLHHVPWNTLRGRSFNNSRRCRTRSGWADMARPPRKAATRNVYPPGVPR